MLPLVTSTEFRPEDKGSLDGQRVWKRVLAAVKEIRREEPREGEAVN